MSYKDKSLVDLNYQNLKKKKIHPEILKFSLNCTAKLMKAVVFVLIKKILV